MEHHSAYSVVMFGDSITQFSTLPIAGVGWGTKLQALYERRADVINRGYGGPNITKKFLTHLGYNTRWALKMLPQIFTDSAFPNVKLITVFFGANDSSVDSNPRNHVPLAEYGENLSKILSHLSQLKTTGTKSGHPHIIVIAPPPIDGKEFLKTHNALLNLNDTESNRNNSVTVHYAKKAAEVAQRFGMPHINLFEEMIQSENWREYLSDGIHLSESGSAFVFERLHKIIKSVEELNPENIPYAFPDWLQVDYETLSNLHIQI